MLEVETPLLCQYGVTDPYIDSFECQGRYLQTSPEYAMKRLLAEGSGPIYQLCKAFRLEEAGRFHNPEFTMLEWYRPGFDHHDLMNETAALLEQCLGGNRAIKKSYHEVFLEHAGIDPHTADTDTLKHICAQLHIHNLDSITDRDTLLQLILSEHIEAKLGLDAPLMIYDYPASQAALAKIRPGTPAVAERFEVYVQGIELANGFHELTDAKEQYQRFVTNQTERQQANKATMAIDPYFINALEKGIGQCAGIALGVDRLLMLQSNSSSIDAVMPLHWYNC